MHRRWFTSAVAAGCLAAACTSSADAPRAATSASSGVTSPTTPTVAALNWQAMRNPIYAPPHMVKDLAVVRETGRWFLYASERWEPSEPDDRHAVSSTDLEHWEPVAATQDQVFNSPDITRANDGTWRMTHQRTIGAGASAVDRIVVSTAQSLAGPWSDAREILGDAFSGQRLIDGAVAETPQGLFLVAKRGDRSLVPQLSEVFHSPSGSIDGPWKHLGTADVGWAENYQFLRIDGTWHLLVTTIPIHHPTLFKMVGDPKAAASWLHWRKVAQLAVPAENWNSPSDGPDSSPGFTHEAANSAYLVDERANDGYFYLFYAGSTELSTHDGRGLAHIGVARSRDLRAWAAPPG